MLTSTRAATNVPAPSRATRSVGARATWVTLNPKVRHWLATSSAVAKAIGLDALSGLSRSNANGVLALGASQPVLPFFQPAAVRVTAAAVGFVAWGALAVGSNAHELGGMGVSAWLPVPDRTPEISAGRSSAWRRALRTAAGASSGWPDRRLMATEVKVVPG